MEEFGVKKNELGFLWVGGVVRFFFYSCSLYSHNLAIKPPN